MQNPSQEPPVSSKAPNQDLKNMDVLCTFKIKIESQNVDHGCGLIVVRLFDYCGLIQIVIDLGFMTSA